MKLNFDDYDELAYDDNYPSSYTITVDDGMNSESFEINSDFSFDKVVKKIKYFCENKL